MKKIEEYCKQLHLSPEAITLAEKIYNFSKTLQKKKRCPTCKKIIQRRPVENKSLIATSIYLASIFEGEARTQFDIQLVTDVAIPTMRKHYPKIAQLKGFRELIGTEHKTFVGYGLKTFPLG